MAFRVLLVSLAAALGLGAAGCSDDGRALAPAPSTTTATVSTLPPSSDGLSVLRLTSTDVTDGGTVDPRLTCDGENEPPTLVITGAPPAAAELAVAVVDLDADGFVHWVVAGLPATTDVLDPDRLPEGSVVGRAGTGVVGWDGPCPPPDDPPHRYEFRAYALAEPAGLAQGVTGADAVAVLEDAAIERATLTATYR